MGRTRLRALAPEQAVICQPPPSQQDPQQEGLRKPRAASPCTVPPRMGPLCQGGTREPHSWGLQPGLPGASLRQPGSPASPGQADFGPCGKGGYKGGWQD